jgi:hypothetical protein
MKAVAGCEPDTNYKPRAAAVTQIKLGKTPLEYG